MLSRSMGLRRMCLSRCFAKQPLVGACPSMQSNNFDGIGLVRSIHGLRRSQMKGISHTMVGVKSDYSSFLAQHGRCWLNQRWLSGSSADEKKDDGLHQQGVEDESANEDEIHLKQASQPPSGDDDDDSKRKDDEKVEEEDKEVEEEEIRNKEEGRSPFTSSSSTGSDERRESSGGGGSSPNNNDFFSFFSLSQGLPKLLSWLSGATAPFRTHEIDQDEFLLQAAQAACYFSERGIFRDDWEKMKEKGLLSDQIYDLDLPGMASLGHIMEKFEVEQVQQMAISKVVWMPMKEKQALDDALTGVINKPPPPKDSSKESSEPSGPISKGENSRPDTPFFTNTSIDMDEEMYLEVHVNFLMLCDQKSQFHAFVFSNGYKGTTPVGEWQLMKIL